MKGLIIFYINMDMIPAGKADEYKEKIEQDNSETLSNIPEEWGLIFLQVHGNGNPTRVEVTPQLSWEEAIPSWNYEKEN